jgi:K+-sensing histidine kinase KdpD
MDGAGLGLAIARGIVKAHGGQIMVEISLGQDSAFNFILLDRKKLYLIDSLSYVQISTQFISYSNN